MTTSEGAAVRTADQAQPSVPAPRQSPREEERPRRRHEGYYWDISAAAWRRGPGAQG